MCPDDAVEEVKENEVGVKENAGKEESDKKPEGPIARAFGLIQKRMVKKFRDRLNSPGDDDCIRHLVLGERFFESFELAKVGDFILSVRFRNTNEEEEAFASNLSLTNREEMSIRPNASPVTDESRRAEILFSLATVSICDTSFDPLNLSEVRENIKARRKERNSLEAKGSDDDKPRVNLSMEFMEDLDDRIVKIKRRLPRGGYSIALRAFQVWLNYQTALLTGTKLENF